MRIVLFCRRNVGLYCLSHLVAKGYKVKVITDDENIRWLAGVYGCELVDLESMGEFDLAISVHWNKIISVKYFNGKPTFNVHPCLDLYRGKNPVKKYIENKNRISSITSHYMIEEVDAGAEIYSETFFTGVISTYQEFYDIALPFYFRVLDKTLEILK